MLSGPTSAKNPILLTFVILASITSPLNCGERPGTYGFEHNGLVPAAELGETRAGHDLALPDIQNRDDLDDIALEVSMRHVRICRSRCLPRRLGACDSLGQPWATYEIPPWTDRRTTDAARCGDRDFSRHKCAANVRGRTWSSRSVSRLPDEARRRFDSCHVTRSTRGRRPPCPRRRRTRSEHGACCRLTTGKRWWLYSAA